MFSESDFCEINQQNVYHSHPIDCTKYVYCNTDSIIEQSCPGNLVYDVSSGQCKNKDDLPCAQQTVESSSVVPNTEITTSQSGIEPSISISRPHTTSENLMSTTMEIIGTQIVSMSDAINLSTSTDSNIQSTETILSVTSSAAQG